jgi:hypothetical protein
MTVTDNDVMLAILAMDAEQERRVVGSKNAGLGSESISAAFPISAPI